MPETFYHYQSLDLYFHHMPPQKIAELLDEYLNLALLHQEHHFKFGTTSELVFHTLYLRDILQNLKPIE
jgi:hypothetical protein